MHCQDLGGRRLGIGGLEQLHLSNADGGKGINFSGSLLDLMSNAFSLELGNERSQIDVSLLLHDGDHDLAQLLNLGSLSIGGTAGAVLKLISEADAKHPETIAVGGLHID